MPFVRRLVVLGLAALAAAALTAGIAQAALWLNFSKASAEPGGIVYVRTAGSGALAGAKQRPVRVFLAPDAEAAQIRSTRDRRLALLGRLRVDRNGNGRLRFATPNVRPGDYSTLMHCPECARYSNGRTLFQTGPERPFKVMPLVRDCESEQYGQLPADWRQRAVHAGPLSLYPIPAATPRPARGKPGRYVPIKVLLIVVPGQRATLVVPKAVRPFVGLAYGHGAARFGAFAPAMRVRDGLAAVTFDSCADGDHPHQHFGGGFVVSKRMCAHLEVSVAGRADPIPLAVPFGAAC